MDNHIRNDGVLLCLLIFKVSLLSLLFSVRVQPETEMDSKNIFRTLETLELVTGILIPYEGFASFLLN